MIAPPIEILPIQSGGIARHDLSGFESRLGAVGAALASLVATAETIDRGDAAQARVRAGNLAGSLAGVVGDLRTIAADVRSYGESV